MRVEDPDFVTDVKVAGGVEIQLRDLRERVPPLRRDPADPVHLLEIGLQRTVLTRWRSGPAVGFAPTSRQQRDEHSATKSH